MKTNPAIAVAASLPMFIIGIVLATGVLNAGLVGRLLGAVILLIYCLLIGIAVGLARPRKQ